MLFDMATDHVAQLELCGSDPLQALLDIAAFLFRVLCLIATDGVH